MATTDSVISITLDNVFAKNDIEKLIPTYSDTYKKIKKADKKKMNANGGFYLVETGAANSLVSSDFAAAAGGDFPQATEGEFLRLNVPPITDRSTIEWNTNVDAQNDDAALKEKPAKDLNYIANDLENIYRFYGISKSRQVWQDRSNELARVSAVDTSTETITCLNSGNLFGVQHIEQGMFVEIFDANGVQRGAGGVTTFKVNRVYQKTGKFTTVQDLTAGMGIANGDIIYPAGSRNNGWAGVKYLAGASGSFEGVSDRTIHPELSGVQLNMSSASLSASVFRRMTAAQRLRRRGKESMGKFYASAQVEAYELTGYGIQVLQAGNGKLDRGVGKISFNGKPIEDDIYVPRDELHYTDFSEVDCFELKKFAPEKWGGTYERPVPAASGQGWSAKKQINLEGFGNLGTDNPAALDVMAYALSTEGLAIGQD